jgi:hypothetical protein
MRPAVQLLPYHAAGEEKRRILGRREAASTIEPPLPSTMERAAEILRERKLLVKIGA